MRESKSNCENKVCNGRNDKKTIEEKREWKSKKKYKRDWSTYIERAEAVGIEKKDGMSQKKRRRKIQNENAKEEKKSY